MRLCARAEIQFFSRDTRREPHSRPKIRFSCKGTAYWNITEVMPGCDEIVLIFKSSITLQSSLFKPSLPVSPQFFASHQFSAPTSKPLKRRNHEPPTPIC